MKETIPDIYEDELYYIDALQASEHPLGIETYEDRITRAFDRMVGCGCGSCKRQFWHEVEKAAEFAQRNGDRLVCEQMEAIIRAHIERSEGLDVYEDDDV